MKIFKCKDKPKDWKGQHVLHCCHSLNKRSKIYYIMYCDILKKMPDGRLKIKVYGQRYTSVETKKILNYSIKMLKQYKQLDQNFM